MVALALCVLLACSCHMYECLFLSEVEFGKTGKVPGAGFVLLQRTCVPFFCFFVATIWRVCLVKEILVSGSNNHTFTNSLLKL